MTTWLVLGASPNAPRYVDRALAANPDIVAVANAGILLLNERNIVPDYFGILEGSTPEKWFRLAPRGVVALMPTGAVELFKLLDIPLPEPREVVESDPTTDKMHPWTRKSRARMCGATGGFLIQMAAKMGATEVHVVGCEGYRSSAENPVADTFDGLVGPTWGACSTANLYGFTVMKVLKATTDIRWVFYGDMAYDVKKCGATVVCDPN